jgi:hypothetical protein
MIASFRSAIFALGSGSLLVAATALSRDAFPTHRFSAATDPSVAQSESVGPARIAREVIADQAEPSPSPTATTDPLTVSSSEQGPIGATAQTPTPDPASDKSTLFQNAALRSAPPPEATTDQPTSSISTKTADLPAETTNAASSVARPIVALKPQERLLASLDHRLTTSAPPADRGTGDLVTRIYHPNSTSVADLQRLIRPLLTPGMGTLVANTDSSTADGPGGDSLLADGKSGPVVVIVRDRAEVMSQIDAIYAELEAAPKRVVIDALIADVALSDSTPPGWELEKSRFGIVDAEPRSVLNLLRSTGRVHVIATNQLQVIDRQWASLEWTQGGSQPSESRWADASASLHLATSFRLRPSILSGGLVRLEVHPTSSRRKDGVSPRPEVATLTFTTDLVLHSGATALIAGTIDERMPEGEPPAVSAKNASRPADAPKIEPQPGVRRQTVLLLMPRVAVEN